MRGLVMLLALTVACGTEDPGTDDTDVAGVDDIDTDPDTDTDTQPRGDVAAGEGVYMEHCSACHASDGSGTIVAPSLQERVPELDQASVEAIVRDGDGDMAAVNLDETDIQDVAAFTVATWGP